MTRYNIDSRSGVFYPLTGTEDEVTVPDAWCKVIPSRILCYEVKIIWLHLAESYDVLTPPGGGNKKSENGIGKDKISDRSWNIRWAKYKIALLHPLHPTLYPYQVSLQKRQE